MHLNKRCNSKPEIINCLPYVVYSEVTSEKKFIYGSAEPR